MVQDARGQKFSRGEAGVRHLVLEQPQVPFPQKLLVKDRDGTIGKNHLHGRVAWHTGNPQRKGPGRPERFFAVFAHRLKRQLHP